eukprot:11701565-Alexandrium_andersonii.AAC.1
MDGGPKRCAAFRLPSGASCSACVLLLSDGVGLGTCGSGGRLTSPKKRETSLARLLSARQPSRPSR